MGGVVQWRKASLETKGLANGEICQEPEVLGSNPSIVNHFFPWNLWQLDPSKK